MRKKTKKMRKKSRKMRKKQERWYKCGPENDESPVTVVPVLAGRIKVFESRMFENKVANVRNCFDDPIF